MLDEKSYLELEIKRFTDELRKLSSQHFFLYMGHSFSSDTTRQISQINQDAKRIQEQLNRAKTRLSEIS